MQMQVKGALPHPRLPAIKDACPCTGDVQGHVRVFSLHSKECLVDRVAHRGSVCSLDFSPTEACGGLLLASGGKDSLVQAFSAQMGYALLQVGFCMFATVVGGACAACYG